MEGPRLDLFLVLGLVVAGAVLVVLGVIFLVFGFGVDKGGLAVVFGVGLLFGAYIVAVESGFIEGWYDGIYSGPF